MGLENQKTPKCECLLSKNMASPIYQAIKQICDEKNIKIESVVETIEAALAAAYRKDFGTKTQNIKVKFNPETGGFRAFDVKTVVDDELVLKYEEEKKEKEKRAKMGIQKEKKEETSEKEDEGELKFNPKLHIPFSEAKKIKADVKVGEILKMELEVPGAFGRMAAQTAKQVIIQKLREAERDTLYQEFKKQEGELLVGVIQRWEGKLVLVDLGRATALLLPEEQIEKEKYSPGSRMKFYVKEVTMTSKGPQIIVSRTQPEILKKLFIFEIPEVANGVVEIKAIAREAGSRSKVAVYTKDENIDPIGSCIGQRGARIQTIINELGGEKIDIIEWTEDIPQLIVNALSPAKIESIEIKEEEKTAYVTVKPDQLSLAIGRGGQNVRLAAKLTGWKINVKEEGKEEIVKIEEEEKEETEKSKEREKKEESKGTEQTPQAELAENKEAKNKGKKGEKTS